MGEWDSDDGVSAAVGKNPQNKWSSTIVNNRVQNAALWFSLKKTE